MDIAVGAVLSLLYTAVAVLARLKGLFCHGLEEPALVLDVERDAPLGEPIAQKAYHDDSSSHVACTTQWR